MIHVLEDVFLDILKSAPVLLAVYALLYFVETRMHTAPAALERAGHFGPVIGAIAGTIPQCGFSAAASTLFNARLLAPATLVAVFIATSDEALPLLIAGAGSPAQILGFIACKLVLAILGSYALQFTVFRRAQNKPRSTSRAARSTPPPTRTKTIHIERFTAL